eukprot:TRINITY_DN5197_c0_g3_i1.p1 TRINITY_DN5197_c0_g3~~TRINITY_DN5197_c0_g3_i1.p1  ORF type:complete len:1541 (+),score=478.33 TRINITY_DN5197_c0_g3_i1:73-4623(+)
MDAKPSPPGSPPPPRAAPAAQAGAPASPGGGPAELPPAMQAAWNALAAARELAAGAGGWETDSASSERPEPLELPGPDPGEDAPHAAPADPGLGFMENKPWLGTVVDAEPTTWSAQQQRRCQLPPSVGLKLDHVHGYRARGVRNNARWVDDDTIVYPAASVGVVHDVENNQQYFYPADQNYSKPRQEITSMDYHAGHRIVVTGTRGTRNTAEMNVWAINEGQRTTRHLQCLVGKLDYAVIAVAFSSDGEKVAGVGADQDHTVAIYDWQANLLLATGLSLQRNRVYDVRWVPAGFPLNDPLKERHVVTGCWKGVYCWTIEQTQGDDKRMVHPAKGKLHPQHDIGSRGGLSRMNFFANETFACISFSAFHVLAAGVSGLIYLFRIEPGLAGAGKRGSGFYVVHTLFAAMPAAQPAGVSNALPPDPADLQRLISSDAPEDRQRRFSLVEEAVRRHQDPAVEQLITELRDVARTFAASRIGASCAEADTAAEECRAALETLKAAWDQTKAAQQDADAERPRLAPVAAALSSFHNELEDLRALAEELWGAAVVPDTDKCMRSAGPRAEMELAKLRNEGSTVAAISQSKHQYSGLALLEQRLGPTREGGLPRRPNQGGIHTRAAWVQGKKLWEAQVLLLDHWRQCAVELGKQRRPKVPKTLLRQKQQAAGGEGPAETGETASLLSTIWCYSGAGEPDLHARYLACGGKNGVVRIFDLLPEGITGREGEAAQSLKVVTPAWDLDLNPHDASTNNVSAATCNGIRSLHVNPARTLMLVGTITAKIFTITHDFTLRSPSHDPSVHCEVEGHHGDLRAHLRKGISAHPPGYGELWGVAAHPAKNLVASTTEDASLRVWDVVYCERVKRRRLGALGWTCAYSGDGTAIAVGFKDGAFALYNSDTLRRQWPRDSLDQSRFRKHIVADIKLSPSDSMIAVACFNFLDVYVLTCREGMVSQVDAVDYKGTCQGLTSPVLHFDWSQDGKFVQVCNKSYELLFYDVAQTAVRYRFLQLTHGRSVRDVSWATQSCTFGWSVQGIWGGEMDGSDINSAARSTTGPPLLATGNDKETLRLYRYPCVGGGMDQWGRCLYPPAYREYVGHASHVTNCAFSFDSKHLFTVGGRDCCLFQWEVEDAGDLAASPTMSPKGPAPAVPPSVGAASPRKPTPPRAPAPAAQPRTTAGAAAALAQALTGEGPEDERRALSLLARVRGQQEFDELLATFRSNHRTIGGGDLFAALKQFLSPAAFEVARGRFVRAAEARRAAEKAGAKLFDTIDTHGRGTVAEREICTYLQEHPELCKKFRKDRQDEYRTKWQLFSDTPVGRKTFRTWYADCLKPPRDPDAPGAAAAAGTGELRPAASWRRASLRRKSSARFASTWGAGDVDKAGLDGTPVRPRTKAWVREHHISVADHMTQCQVKRREKVARHRENIERAKATEPMHFDWRSGGGAYEKREGRPAEKGFGGGPAPQSARPSVSPSPAGSPVSGSSPRRGTRRGTRRGSRAMTALEKAMLAFQQQQEKRAMGRDHV